MGCYTACRGVLCGESHKANDRSSSPSLVLAPGISCLIWGLYSIKVWAPYFQRSSKWFVINLTLLKLLSKSLGFYYEQGVILIIFITLHVFSSSSSQIPVPPLDPNLQGAPDSDRARDWGIAISIPFPRVLCSH